MADASLSSGTRERRALQTPMVSLARLLSGHGLGSAGVRRLEGRTEVWRVRDGRIDAIVRRNPAPLERGDIEDGARWVHKVLQRLPTVSVDVPRPVPLFSGDSVTVADDAVWEALTFVPGRVAGWAATPSMFEFGQFVGSFHDAASMVKLLTQRPGVAPVSSLPDAVKAIALSRDERAVLGDAMTALVAALEAVGHDNADQSFIHGDLTNHNILVAGDPPRPTGIIDFANGYREVTLADVGFALWRSGRPFQGSVALDVERVKEYVAGYHSRRRLDARDSQAVAAHLLARGVQMIVKQGRLGASIDRAQLARVEWVSGNLGRLREELTAVVMER